MNKIVLMGYMGSGKSVVAALLATRIPYRHIDLDQYIESHTKMSVAELFSKKGEVYFRKIEHQLLKEILTSESRLLLSLGGGTPCYANNIQLLQEAGVKSFYLKASIDELFNRLASEKKQRPLIATIPTRELKEFIAKSLFERSFFYNQADHVILVDNKSPDAIVSEIMHLAS